MKKVHAILILLFLITLAGFGENYQNKLSTAAGGNTESGSFTLTKKFTLIK